MAKARGWVDLGHGSVEVRAEGNNYYAAEDNLRYLYPNVRMVGEVYEDAANQPRYEYDDNEGFWKNWWRENFGIFSPRVVLVLVGLAGGSFLFWKVFIAPVDIGPVVTAPVLTTPVGTAPFVAAPVVNPNPVCNRKALVGLGQVPPMWQGESRSIKNPVNGEINTYRREANGNGWCIQQRDPKPYNADGTPYRGNGSTTPYYLLYERPVQRASSPP